MRFSLTLTRHPVFRAANVAPRRMPVKRDATQLPLSDYLRLDIGFSDTRTQQETRLHFWLYGWINK